MKTFYKNIIFSTSLPDDQIDDGHEIVHPRGEGVAKAVRDLLQGAGMIPTEPQMDFEHGWDFYVKIGRRRYWILISDLDQVILQTEDMSPILERLFNKKDSHADFMQILHGLLSQDQRFSSVEWFSG